MDNNRTKLIKVLDAFVSDTFFVPVVGAEIEFYLKNGSHEKIAKYCDDAGINYLDIKAEEGEDQWEVSTTYRQDPVAVADEIMKIREAIKGADFSAKPKPDDYGSSLHVHISMLDKSGDNVLQKSMDEESQFMEYAVGGLLETMPKYMNVFAPYEACYERLRGGKDAPATISWGGNNRTVALRLPTTTQEPENRRIEHRVSAADSDPYLVISAILEGISYGLTHKIFPSSDKIYGNASLESYGLPKIVK